MRSLGAEQQGDGLEVDMKLEHTNIDLGASYVMRPAIECCAFRESRDGVLGTCVREGVWARYVC